MTNILVLGALLVAFATFVTCHLAIAVRLVWAATPRYRGVIALVVPPLAPMWAYREQWRKLCWTWVTSLTAYAVTIAIAALVV